MSRLFTSLFAAVAVVGAVAVFVFGGDSDRDGSDRDGAPAPRPGSEDRSDVAPAVTPRIAEDLPVEAPPDDGPAFVQPDGSRLPLLNGVDEMVVLKWPSNEPFSPIVGRRLEPNGVEWYVHEDGSRSTVQMVYRSDLGRRVAMTQLARPVAPLPVEPGEADQQGGDR